MKFYQQKYFRPYQKIATQAYLNNRSSPYNQSYNDSQEYYDSLSKGKRAPAFQRSPSKYVAYPQTTPEPIWEHLYNQGVRSKKELIQKQNNITKNKIDLQCTFQPMIRHNQRYINQSSSSFLQRVSMWNQQKIEKIVKEKQEQVNKDLKECTFTPRINEQKPRIEQKKIVTKLDKSQAQLKQRNKKVNPYYSPIKQANSKGNASIIRTKPSLHIQMTAAKQLIKNQLKKLVL